MKTIIGFDLLCGLRSWTRLVFILDSPACFNLFFPSTNSTQFLFAICLFRNLMSNQCQTLVKSCRNSGFNKGNQLSWMHRKLAFWLLQTNYALKRKIHYYYCNLKCRKTRNVKNQIKTKYHITIAIERFSSD